MSRDLGGFGQVILGLFVGLTVGGCGKHRPSPIIRPTHHSDVRPLMLSAVHSVDAHLKEYQ